MGNKSSKQFPCHVVSCIYQIEFKMYPSEINWVRMNLFRSFISFEFRLTMKSEHHWFDLFWLLRPHPQVPQDHGSGLCKDHLPSPTPMVPCSLWQMTSTVLSTQFTQHLWSIRLCAWWVWGDFQWYIVRDLSCRT